MAGVASLDDVDALVDRLCDNAYTTSAEFNATLTDRKWLMRWRDGHRTHHLHIVVHGGTPWRDRLAFRDALRRDAALAARYAALKSRPGHTAPIGSRGVFRGEGGVVAGVISDAQGR